jgi:hypothetical protein
MRCEVVCACDRRVLVMHTECHVCIQIFYRLCLYREQVDDKFVNLKAS